MDSFTNNNNTTGNTGGLTGGSGLGNSAGGSTTGTNAQHNDYGDKIFDAAAKKSGHPMNASTSEKITDGARGLFEKATGKKVDPKYSN